MVSTIVTADSKKDGGIGHVRLEWPVTIRWNERSRSFGIGGHVGVEYAQAALRPLLLFPLDQGLDPVAVPDFVPVAQQPM